MSASYDESPLKELALELQEVSEKYRKDLRAKRIVRFALIWSEDRPIEINDVTYPGPA